MDLDQPITYGTALTKRLVLTLAARSKGFYVTWRYRDQTLERACQRLRKKGLLRCTKRSQGETIFAITDLGRTALEATS